MKLRKCLEHEKIVYTFQDNCPQCNKPTKDAHYKFVKVKSKKK
ncbi:MAG: nucleolar RNA-binding Nop10p family protein [Nanoarchaeota archaeon]